MSAARISSEERTRLSEISGNITKMRYGKEYYSRLGKIGGVRSAKKRWGFRAPRKSNIKN
jgi:hypothetical protein